MKSETFTRVAKVGELKGAGPFALSANGADVVLVRAGDGWRAFEGRCPPQGALLGEGEIEGGALVCRNHRWRFAIDSGRREGGPECLASCPVAERDGGVFVDVTGLKRSSAAKAGDAFAGRPARAQRVAGDRQSAPDRLDQGSSHSGGLGGPIRLDLPVPDGLDTHRRDERRGDDRRGVARKTRDVSPQPQDRPHHERNRDQGCVQRRGRGLASAAQAFCRGARAAQPASALPAASERSPSG